MVGVPVGTLYADQRCRFLLYLQYKFSDDLPLFGTAAMSEVVPAALILGHSFVKRLKRDLHQGFDS